MAWQGVPLPTELPWIGPLDKHPSLIKTRPGPHLPLGVDSISLPDWNYSNKPITYSQRHQAALHLITTNLPSTAYFVTLFPGTTSVWPCGACGILCWAQYMWLSNCICQVSGVSPSPETWGEKNPSLTNKVKRGRLRVYLYFLEHFSNDYF